jgi:hypothetical protein
MIIDTFYDKCYLIWKIFLVFDEELNKLAQSSSPVQSIIV